MTTVTTAFRIALALRRAARDGGAALGEIARDAARVDRRSAALIARRIRRIVAADSARRRSAETGPGPLVVVEIGIGEDPILRSRRPL